jgi:hypothetical protein
MKVRKNCCQKKKEINRSGFHIWQCAAIYIWAAVEGSTRRAQRAIENGDSDREKMKKI